VTFGSGGQRSIQLSYGRASLCLPVFGATDKPSRPPDTMPPMRWSVVVALALACGGAQLPAARDPSLTMLEAGAEPRQLMRYALVPHAPERLELDIKAGTTARYGPNPFQMKQRFTDYPTVVLVGRVEVSAVAADGAAQVALDLDDVVVRDDVMEFKVRQPIEEDAAQMKGARVAWQIAPSGKMSAPTIAAPRAAAAAQRRLSSVVERLQGAMVVFPDVPIGVGARWKVASEYRSSNMSFRYTGARTVTYRLKTMTDTTATVAIEESMHAGSQTVSVEPDRTTSLISGGDNTIGEVIVPLRALVASGSVTGFEELDYEIARGLSRLAVTIKTQVTTSIQPQAGSGSD
jgi:hypothetical protein